MNTIEIYGSVSGLRLNKDKTKMVWIGRKKHCKEKLDISIPLNWACTEFDLLGIKFSVDLETMINLNYKDIVTTLNNQLNNWKKDP